MCNSNYNFEIMSHDNDSKRNLKQHVKSREIL